MGFGIAVTIGGTIGTGILRKPGVVAAYIGDPILIMVLWVLISVYAFFGVLCAIELAVSLPRAGSWYVYAHRAFGNYAGFITGFTSWMGTVSALGFGAFTMAEYIVLLDPDLDGYHRSIAIGILLTLTLFHFSGTKSGGKSQELFSFFKSWVFLSFVILVFINTKSLDYSQLSTFNQKLQRPSLFLGLVGALQAIFYTFDGWHTASYFSEENQDPVKSLPKSMIIGVLVIIFIYLSFNAAILYLIPVDILANSKLAAADAVILLFGMTSGKVVTFFLMVSILGLVNAQIMFSPRVIFSMSRDGLFPSLFLKVSSLGVPVIAMPLTVFCSILLILNGKSVSGLLSDIAAFFFVMTYMAGFMALIKLRKSEPDLPRPFKVPLYPVTPLILTIVSFFFLLGATIQDPKSSKFALAFLLLSYPMFRLFRKNIQKKS